MTNSLWCVKIAWPGDGDEMLHCTRYVSGRSAFEAVHDVIGWWCASSPAWHKETYITDVSAILVQDDDQIRFTLLPEGKQP